MVLGFQRKLLIFALAAFGIQTDCTAGVINFETVPGVGMPAQGILIGDQYVATQGVRFRLADGSMPVLAEVGDPAIGFVSGPFSMADELLPGHQVGRFFLTDSMEISNIPQDIILTFTDPVALVGGRILDVDFRANTNSHEGWRFEIFSSTDTSLGFIDITTSTPGAGDGLATPWEFSRFNADIASLRISYIGSPTGLPGFGLDDFVTSITVVPEPGSLLLLSLGLPGWIGYRRSRNKLRLSEN